MNLSTFTPFYSIDTLNREFDFIHKSTNKIDNENFLVVIKKDLSLATIGKPGIRGDKKPGIVILGTIYFKKIIFKNILEIDEVDIGKQQISKGYGILFHLALINAGYLIVVSTGCAAEPYKLWRLAR